MKSTRNLAGMNAIALFVMCELIHARRVEASAQLPVPCVAGSCGGSAPANFVSSGQASAVQAGNTLTVNQTSDKATLNWQSFNISADGKVQFNQPTANSVALNRIYQQTPSSIFGQLSANGQIYLVNPNGIVFGSTATVNAAGIIASSLGISDDNFSKGLLDPSLLNNKTPALSADPNATTTPGDVTVQAGATISTPSGRIMLAAPNVTNSGTLTAADGQVVLAAGQKVYLQASTDPGLRGLIVEVDGGGTAANTASGQISTPRGNTTLVGLAVNQSGRISATTSIAANGSVRLEAADNTLISASGSTNTIAATEGGTLTIAPQSTIEIDIESSNSQTAPYNANQLQSNIALTGKQVFIDGGSIKAPNANLTVIAADNPFQASAANNNPTNGNTDAQIRIHSGASIDVSGGSAELPVSANLLAIQLRSNELADDPTQRNGALRGQTVYVDTRVGTSIVGATALQAAEQAVARNEAFWTTKGGNVSFVSEGDIVAEKGSSINVSGGQTVYDGGVIQTTKLLGANGKLYDIGSASQLMTYTGIVNPTFTQSFNKWGVQSVVTNPGMSHYESGYTDGANAGSIQFAAPTMALGGALLGQVTNGTHQRGSTAAAGGKLIFGIPGGITGNAGNTNAGITDYLSPAMIVVDTAPDTALTDGTPLSVQPLRLGANTLTGSGFTNIQFYSNSSFTLPSGLPLTLAPGTSFLVDAPRIDIGSNITAASGNIQLQSVYTGITPVPNVGYPGIQIESGVTLDVRGQWVNDSAVLGGSSLAAGPTLQDGGKISIDTSPVDPKYLLGDDAQLILGDNVSLRASGGGWVSRTNALTGGKGGQISILSAAVGPGIQFGSGLELDAFGVNGAKGGQFTLRVPRIEISQGTSGSTWADAQQIDELTAPGRFLTLHSSLFTDYGFASVNLTATAATSPTDPDVLRVDSGTNVIAQQQTLLLGSNYLTRTTGTDLDTFAHQSLMPAYLRSPMSVSLNAIPQTTNVAFIDGGRLDIEKGASLSVDPGTGGSISLTGTGGIYDDGILQAPGGSITLETPVPPLSTDPGYLANLGIELGPQSVLDVSGTFIQKPSTQGFLLGTLLDGGSVGLLADRGTVVTDPGSLINVSGSSHALDIPVSYASPTYGRQLEGSAGGSITVRSPEAISLGGDMEAAAGTGTYGNPAGGSLEVDLTRLGGWFKPTGDGTPPLPEPADGLVIELVSSAKGLAPSTSDSGLAVLGVDQLTTSGFDSLHLVSFNTVRFSTSKPVSVPQQVILDAPTIAVDDGVHGSVSANYVQLADSQLLPANAALAQTGTGTFTAKAQQIDLYGATAFSGTQQVTLDSAGDVMLRGVLINTADTYLQGSLQFNGALDIEAARIYPATQTIFNILGLDTGSSVHIGQSSASPGVPLSANGVMSITADNIDSAGTLLAPFGMISLTANQTLTLESTSVTSVSAAGATIPYGLTQLGGKTWVYNQTGTGAIDGLPVSGIPTRQVSLSGQTIDQKSGAKVDLSGGGDLYSFEWVPGTGGTKDALLGSTSSAAGLYAIVPSMIGQFAPYDPQETGNTNLQAGNNIYLSGIAGLPAGIYPLLPARDALLPGAFLVQVQTGYSNIIPGQKASLSDGTPVIAGYKTFGTTGQRDGGYVGVAVWPGSYGQQLAQYDISLASNFFSAAATAAGNPRPPLPDDAGKLLLSADASLNLAGTVLTAPGDSKGQRATVEITAPNLEVIGDQGTAAPGAVGVQASVVSSWQVGSLLLGGNATKNPSTGTTIAVSSDNVTVDSGAQLQADQVLLVANQQIDLKSGSSVLSTSAGSGGKAPAALPAESDYQLTNASGSGAALVAVSDLALPVVQRSGSMTGAANVNVESGATLGSRGALSVDAPGTVLLDGTLNGAGASWSLASSSVGFGAGNGASETLQLTQPVITGMEGAGAIRVSSLGAIDFNTAVQFGSRSSAGAPSISSLTLSAQSLNNTGAGDGSSFTAATITLLGAGDLSTVNPTVGSGTLAFDANDFVLQSGTPSKAGSAIATAIGISGFANTSINAANSFSSQLQATAAPGSQAALVTAGNLSITAPVFTAGTGASGQVNVVNGNLSLNGSGGTATAGATGLGGSLGFAADSISLTGRVLAPAGKVTLQAANDIDLGANAAIDVSGPVRVIGNQTLGAEGGNVIMTAGGNLTLASGSSIVVSGGDNAPAGQILMTATGVADVSGQLTGQAANGIAGGVFSLEAGSLNQSLDTLAANLGSGGFNTQQAVRVHSGNLVLSSSSTITSNKVNLTTDSGTVDIAGTISAPSADLSGAIGLFGGTGVTLESTGRLIADTQNSARGVGGAIELGTGSAGTVNLAGGSLIEAKGPTADGTLRIRAPLTAGGTDIAVNLAGSNLPNLSGIYIEPVITETPTGATGPTASDYAQFQTDVGTMLANAGTNITNRLNPSGTAKNFFIRPAVDVVQSGDLVLDNAPDFSTWQFNGQPVDLTFRATGNLTVSASMMDGFAAMSMPPRGTTLGLMSNYASMDFRFISGADIGSSNPLATVHGAAADLTIAANTMVATGTGDIDLVSAHDVVFGGSKAMVFTAGQAGSPTEFTKGQRVFNYPTGGGSVLVQAGNNITGFVIPAGTTSSAAGLGPNTWITRKGDGSGTPAAWGVDLAQYKNYGWNVGSLGGGDISVTSGGDIDNLSAAASDSYKGNTDGTYTHNASGSLDVRSVGDIATGAFYVANGSSLISAGGALSSDRTAGNIAIGSLIAMGDAQVSLQARLGATVDGVMNPFIYNQYLASPDISNTRFVTYGPNSSISLQTSAGDVNLRSNLGQLIGTAASSGGGVQGNFLPGTLIARSLSEDVSISKGLLAPAANGQLQLVAARDINLPPGSVVTGLRMSDAGPGTYATPLTPGALSTGVITIAQGDIHASDPTAAAVVAGRDITGALAVPKQTDIIAGRDMVNLSFQGQNLNSSDLTLISAGRDYVDLGTSNTSLVQVGGPGRALLLAGRNVDLGTSLGIDTTGNLLNSNLPTSRGADLTVMAGLGQTPDYTDFLTKVVEPSTVDQAALIDYVEQASGRSSLSFADAEALFKGYNVNDQRSLLNQIFFNELALSGTEDNTVPGAGFSRGYAAIDALFPNSRSAVATGASPYSGDLSLEFSRIYTLSGGDINLLVPGGSIDVGLANPPPSVLVSVGNRPASQLGIVAEGPGNVNIYSKSDVNVNSSRIFTLGGGNILIWSDEGNIDAGKGAKTSLSAPPPTVLVNSDGSVSLNFQGAVAGSGIRTIQVSNNINPGNVELIAPLGTVNAGDAGIGAAGNITIAAAHVLGLDNIQFGGTSIGVPSPVSDIGVSLSGASNVTSGATNSAAGNAAEEARKAAAATPLTQAAISWLDVFVMGLGEETCRTDDLDCLKRQPRQ